MYGQLQVEIEALEVLRTNFGPSFQVMEPTLRFEHWAVGEKQYVAAFDKHGLIITLRAVPSDGPVPFILAGGSVPFPAGTNINPMEMVRDAKYPPAHLNAAWASRRAEISEVTGIDVTR
jgi:hypothetical protein